MRRGALLASGASAALLWSCTRSASTVQSDAVAGRQGPPAFNVVSRAVAGRPTDTYSTVLLDRDARALVTTTAPPGSSVFRCESKQSGVLSFALDRALPVGTSISFSTTRYAVVLARDSLVQVVAPGGAVRGSIALIADRVLALDSPPIGLRAHVRLAPLLRFADAAHERDATARSCLFTACALVGAALILGGHAAKPVEEAARRAPALTAWAAAVFQSIEAWSAQSMT